MDLQDPSDIAGVAGCPLAALALLLFELKLRNKKEEKGKKGGIVNCPPRQPMPMRHAG
jgi:hypothetical protein